MDWIRHPHCLVLHEVLALNSRCKSFNVRLVTYLVIISFFLLVNPNHGFHIYFNHFLNEQKTFINNEICKPIIHTLFVLKRNRLSPEYTSIRLVSKMHIANANTSNTYQITIYSNFSTLLYRCTWSMLPVLVTLATLYVSFWLFCSWITFFWLLLESCFPWLLLNIN